MNININRIYITTVLWMALALIIFAVPCRGYGSQLSEGMTWRAEINKQRYLPGEPVLVTLVISNDANQPKRIAFAGGDEAFAVSLTDSNGILVMHGANTKEPRDVYDKGLLDIPAKGTARRSFVLNHRCSTLVQQGDIIAACTIRYYNLSERQRIEVGGVATKTPAPECKAQVTFSFEITAPDEARYMAILAELAQKISDLRVARALSSREGLESRIASIEMLAFAEGDAAVPYQLELLRDDRLAYRQMYALESLERTASVSAAKGLISVLEDPVSKCGINDKTLILAVYKMREKNLPGVREATEEFVKKHPRPIEPKVPYIAD